MKRIRKIIFAAASLILLIGVPQSSAKITLEHPEFIKQYQTRYSNFTFESQSRLSIRQAGTLHKETGFSVLGMDDQENFVLKRKLFSSENPLIVLRMQLDTRLKLPESEKFQKTTFLPEFKRWKEISIEEIISLYEQMGFEDRLRSPPQIKDGQHCWSIETSFICFDPKSELPVNGSIRLEVSASAYLEANFQFTERSADQVFNLISDALQTEMIEN